MYICTCYVCTYKWNITQTFKKWNLAICDNMDGAWRHSAKWNKTDEERQIPYNFSYMEYKKQNKNKLIDSENRLLVTRREGDQVYGDGWLLVLLITLYCTPILIYNIVYLKSVWIWYTNFTPFFLIKKKEQKDTKV